MRTVSLTALRRIAIAAQGYATRSRAGTARRGGGGDPPALVRAARLDLGGRAQPPDRARARASARTAPAPCRACSSSGRVFEYWAHEACLLPVEEWPLFAAQMRHGGRRWYGDVGETHPHLADEILAEIRARGPLGSRHFEGTSEGGMWNWKPAKAMLDRLWNHGDLVIAGRQGFQRLYDLPERVIPKEMLDAPVPDRARAAAGARGEGRRRARRAHRGRDRRALAAQGRRRAHPARRRRARRRRRPRARRGRRRRRARPRAARAPTSTPPRPRPRCCCRRSTTSSGTGRSPGACSASTT